MNSHYSRSTTLCIAAILLLLAGTTNGTADTVAPDDVRRAVETWVQRVTADARPDAGVELLEPWIVDGATTAYVAHLTAGGFCLCGADDWMLPVYLYVPSAEFDRQSPSFQFVLQEIDQRTSALRAAVPSGADPQLPAQLTDRAAYWRDLIAGIVPGGGAAPRGAPGMMVLPLTSAWNQGSPYNDYCPSLTPSEQTVTGCVATATAQIMYYWKWPPTGEGQWNTVYPYVYRLNWDSEPLAGDPGISAGQWVDRLRWNAATQRLEMNGYWDVLVQNTARNIAINNAPFQAAMTALFSRMTPGTTNNFANFGATAYNWSAMRDTVADPPGAAAQAVALLSYHAGIACYMNWGIWGSFTGYTEKLPALRDHFRYDADIVSGAPSSGQITGEIQWLRPVTMGGTGVAGGHDWIILGYNAATDPNRQFFVNFGWGGASNGWYSLDPIGTVNGSFTSQTQVSRIAPRYVVRFVDTVGGGDGTPDAPYGSLNQALQEAPNGVTLVFKAGSLNTTGGLITIGRPLTLKGHDVTIQP